MSEHEQLLNVLGEIRDRLDALIGLAGAGDEARGGDDELLSLRAVDRILARRKGFAEAEVRAGRMGSVAVGARLKVARWQLRAWQGERSFGAQKDIRADGCSAQSGDRTSGRSGVADGSPAVSSISRPLVRGGRGSN